MKEPMLNKLQPKRLALSVFFGICAASSSVMAAPGGGQGPGGGGGGGHQPPSGETGVSNLSFPVILSDNVAPIGFPQDGAWRFAEITEPATQCVGQTTPVPSVDPDIPCYYGQHVSVDSETGDILFDGPVKVWWLQKRPANFWKAFSIGHNSAETKLAVSAIDIGDLLESTPSIATRQIRTEFNMLQSVSSSDPEFGTYVVPSWPVGGNPAQCTIPSSAGQSVGCFAAVGMSGAVPGTEQSGNEAQGADFGPGGAGMWPGTRVLLDPTTGRTATDEFGAAIPIHALVYSNCARLVIQKVAGSPVWDPATGLWSGSGVGNPVVNVASYNGSYTTEINSGGGIVYGYNWNAKTLATGTYRLTFVLDGNDTTGPQCPTNLMTEFNSSITKLVNFGEANTPHIVYAGGDELQGGDEGGLVYLDLELATKGGGKKGGGGRP